MIEDGWRLPGQEARQGADEERVNGGSLQEVKEQEADDAYSRKDNHHQWSR